MMSCSPDLAADAPKTRPCRLRPPRPPLQERDSQIGSAVEDPSSAELLYRHPVSELGAPRRRGGSVVSCMDIERHVAGALGRVRDPGATSRGSASVQRPEMPGPARRVLPSPRIRPRERHLRWRRRVPAKWAGLLTGGRAKHRRPHCRGQGALRARADGSRGPSGACGRARTSKPRAPRRPRSARTCSSG